MKNKINSNEMISTIDSEQISENEKIEERFQQAMDNLNKDFVLYDRGCFLPNDMVNDLISAAKSGTVKSRITALQLLAAFAIRNQITTLEPLQGVACFKMAAELGDKGSAFALKNYMDLLLDEKEKERLVSGSLLNFLDQTTEIDQSDYVCRTGLK